MFRITACRISTMLLLLAAAATAAAQEPTERDLARVRFGTKEEPWLRIDAKGHTGAVRALAFTPDSSRLCSGGLDKNVEVWNLSALRDLRRVFLRERRHVISPAKKDFMAWPPQEIRGIRCILPLGLACGQR